MLYRNCQFVEGACSFRLCFEVENALRKYNFGTVYCRVCFLRLHVNINSEKITLTASVEKLNCS